MPGEEIMLMSHIGQSQTNPTAGYAVQTGRYVFRGCVWQSNSILKKDIVILPDSIINTNDRTYLGKTIPGYFYGFNFAANWKGLDLSVFFQGVGDVQKYNSTRAGLESMGGLANQSTYCLDRWTSTNPSNNYTESCL